MAILYLQVSDSTNAALTANAKLSSRGLLLSLSSLELNNQPAGHINRKLLHQQYFIVSPIDAHSESKVTKVQSAARTAALGHDAKCVQVRMCPIVNFTKK